MTIIEVSLLDLTLRTRDTLDSFPYLTVQRMVFISWELPSLTFLKVNFDGNVTDGTGGDGFMIRDLDSQFIEMGGIRLMDTSMPKVELRAAREGVTYARMFL